MKLRSAILGLRTVIPKLKDDIEYSRMFDFTKDDMEQKLAWLEELQAYRDTGLTPEQVNLTEATLWKEQGLIARESDRDVWGHWRSADDLPEPRRDVLIYYEDCREKRRRIGIGYVWEKKWSGYINKSIVWSDVTVLAWLPLPGVPGEVEVGHETD